MAYVIPVIVGRKDRQLATEGNKLFTNLEKFHPDLTVPQPDKYDGARPTEIDPPVRRDLNGYIVPSTAKQLPTAPNNFMEVKGQSGRSDVLQRQAMYAGAVGARGMFELQNYGNETPVYDGNAYTTMGSYHAGEGSLRMYATHPRQSATGQTEYYMTQLRSYAMTDTSESFRQGAAALRNSRDLSKEQRDRFIASANATARRLPAVDTSFSGTASRSPVSSRTQGASFESDTSTDELAPEYQEPPKRQRKGSTATARQSESARNRGRQPQQSLHSTSSSASQPSPASAQGRHLWLGYSFKPLQDGTYEFNCTVRGRAQNLTAKWAPGQTCPQIFSRTEKGWSQSSVERQSLRLFEYGRWITLGKRT